MGFIEFITTKFFDFLSYTGFANATIPNLIRILDYQRLHLATLYAL